MDAQLLDALRPLAQERIRALTAEIEVLVKFINGRASGSDDAAVVPRHKRRKMSAAGRRAISRAQKARWVARKKEAA